MLMSLIRRPAYAGSIIYLLIVLAGCNNAATGPVPTSTTTDGSVVVPPTPTTPPTIDPNCVRREVEDWLQSESEFSFALINALGEAITLPPTGVKDVIDRLTTYQGALNQVKVPACAADHAVLVKGLFTRIIERLTAYQSGQTVELGKVYEEANQTYAEIRRIDQELRQRYQGLAR
jgi:hypothetical protein